MAGPVHATFAQTLSLRWLRRSRLPTVSNRSRSPLCTLSHPAFRRKMSSYSFKLEDLKASEWGEHPNASTAFEMKRSGFHRWGFAIYRTTYDDDAAWDRYLEILKVSALRTLKFTGGDVLLEQYMDWPVISDPVGLEGASKTQVRRHFKNWCAARSEERDGPGATNGRVKGLPRFNYCLYVDRRCLDTLANLPADYFDVQSRRKLQQSEVVVVAIDGAFDERTHDSEQGLQPEVEGCAEWYVGWRYEYIDRAVATYEDCHGYSLDDLAYRRPPLISTFGQKSMPN